jgi:hypothetical protein
LHVEPRFGQADGDAQIVRSLHQLGGLGGDALPVWT